MEFKIYRNNSYIGNINLYKAGAEWEPIDDDSLKKGDILESVTDGARLEVMHNNPHPYIHPMLKLRLLDD